MRRSMDAWLCLVLAAAACGDDEPAEVGRDAGSARDAGPGDDAGEPDAAADGGTDAHRTSLAVCWTDADCPRVMAIAHGGAWDLDTAPYDSDAALANAYAAGDDGVKIDVRITADGVPVIAHSSPIEGFESDDCDDLVIEESTAAQVTACHRFPSSTETFQRLDDVLEDLRGKMVAQLTVKRSEDYAGAIAAVLAAGAEDFAFFEIEASELGTVVPALPDADRVWYLVQVNDLATEVDLVLDLANPRAFMLEFEPTDDVADLVTTRLHPAGVRSFTYDRAAHSVEEIRALYDAGFDVVSTQFGDNGVAARILVNEGRGVSPP